MMHVPPYPQVLQRFRGLPGPYGTINITAQSSEVLELAMTQEWLQLNRDDAQELIRVLTTWLAGPAEAPTVVETHGAGSTVVIADDGPGVPRVVVVDGDGGGRTVVGGSARHYDAARRPT